MAPSQIVSDLLLVLKLQLLINPGAHDVVY
jgi:hypothetical protein